MRLSGLGGRLRRDNHAEGMVFSKRLNIRENFSGGDRGIDERVETFFSLRMRHHAGRPTTDHSTETMGINSYSPRETDDFTQILDKYEIKA